MTAPSPIPAAPEPISATAPARALIEEQIALLTRLAQVGVEIAEAAGRRAVAAAPAGESVPAPEFRSFEPAPDPGLTFARAARAVRMTIALQSRLMKDLAALDRADDNAAASAKDARRIRLSRLVAQAVEAKISDEREAARAAPAGQGGDAAYWSDERVEDEIERLSEEAYERLTDAEDDLDLDDRPFAEVVAAICGDLGLSPDWTARLLAATGAATEPHVTPAPRYDPYTDLLPPAALERSGRDDRRPVPVGAPPLETLAVKTPAPRAPPPDAARLGP